MFSKLYDFILLCFILYNFCHFSIFFIFYNHLFIDVYAHNSWCVCLSRLRGRVTGTGPPSPSPEKRREAASRAHAFFYPRLFILFLKSPDPLLGTGSIKKEQPPDGSCSLIPKGFHYIYFIPYIGIRSSVLLLLPQELPCEPLPFPFRSQPGRKRLLP